MFQIYFCIGLVVSAVALSIGLISGVIFMPLEVTDKSFFSFAGKIAGWIAGTVILLIYFLKKTGRVKIKKNLIKNLNR